MAFTAVCNTSSLKTLQARPPVFHGTPKLFAAAGRVPPYFLSIIFYLLFLFCKIILQNNGFQLRRVGGQVLRPGVQ